MARLLSRILILFILSFCAMSFSQNAEDIHRPQDYKNKKEFEKFAKRRKIVSNWQINELKNGALVIKLKTNNIYIEQLNRDGNKEMAESVKLESMVVNKSIMLAFLDHFKFCKLYFTYSYYGDSLMRGARKGIFLDTNLAIDPNIEMTESFYLVGERDRVYNSSIGFVPKDSAMLVREKGNASGYDVLAVLKNRYGHQLKKPFPYICGYGIKNSGVITNVFIKSVPVYYYLNESYGYSITIDKTQLLDYKNSPAKNFKPAPVGAMTFKLNKLFAYETLSASIIRFNEDLHSFYQANPPVTKDRIPEDVLPFLY